MTNRLPINRKLTPEQNAQILEFVKAYNIEPDDVIYFDKRLDPFFKYEAACIICNELLDLQDISIEPTEHPFSDAYSVRCSIISGERRRSAVGVANLREQIDGKEINEMQALALASSRALRNALRAGGIDLVKAHYKAQATGETSALEAANQPETLRVKLLGQVHKIGQEIGLIHGGDKTLWYSVIQKRYLKSTSADLDETQLADFVAFLSMMQPINTVQAKAA